MWCLREYSQTPHCFSKLLIEMPDNLISDIPACMMKFSSKRSMFGLVILVAVIVLSTLMGQSHKTMRYIFAHSYKMKQFRSPPYGTKPIEKTSETGKILHGENKNINKTSTSYTSSFQLQNVHKLTSTQATRTVKLSMSSSWRSGRNISSPQHRAVNIAFIKTLKTGSTTLQSIVNRFGLLNNLSFILNRRSIRNGHFYNLVFDDDMAERYFLPPINVSVGDYAKYRNYNAIAVHIRYNRVAMEKYLVPETKYITIIREPSSQWESAFHHFQFYDAIISPNSSKDVMVNPRNASLWLGGNTKNTTIIKETCGTKVQNVSNRIENCSIIIRKLLKEFMRDPETYREELRYLTWEKEIGRRYHYSRNNQIYELGLEPVYHENVTAIMEWIKRLQGQMDLVLVNEYFDESLVLMRKMFSWRFEDIVYITKNVRVKTGQPAMTDQLRAKIRRWNSADVLLYEAFNRTLWKRITDYGPTFQSDLTHFRELQEAVTRNCTEKRENTLWDRDHVFGHHEAIPRPGASIFCQTVAESKTALHYRVYCRQQRSLKSSECRKAKFNPV